MPVDPGAVGSDAAAGASFGPWGALAGAGIGLLGGLFNGGPQTQTVTNTGDPALGQYLQYVRQMAQQGYGNLNSPSVSPGFTNSMQSLGQMGSMGTDAMSAMLGLNPAGQSAAMNPYMSAMNPVFDRLRQAAVSNARLGSSSPFGIGQREGLAQSAALNGVGQQEAQFNYQGFSDAMNRLQGAAGMGLSADQAMQSGGQWQTMLPMLWQQMRMGLLSPGLMSNGANTQTNEIPNTTNPIESGIGGALAGSQIWNQMHGAPGGNPRAVAAGPGGPSTAYSGNSRVANFGMGWS
jgi:hypothetical protein